ncbi:MAG: calcium-binding protein, partial [Deltaproteobacteria bacterium]|nr:calcium-binding protein [Deltaproteobacteria bacterium]
MNLFDADTTDEYTIRFADESSGPHPPVLQFIPDQSIVENRQVSFIVQATDPDGTTPSLSATPLPAGALFTDQGDGTAVFDWTPSIGQAGIYHITFKASDGTLEDTQAVTITVNSADDTDGDSMPDSWEMDHFGTLDRDGTGDFDGDGISDLDEYLYGTDPTVRNHAPSTPVIQSPADAGQVDTTSPELVITNSTDADGDRLSYEFEVFSDPGLSTMVSSGSNIAEGTGQTSWTPPEPLNDNSRYYWRVRATDGYSFSLWAYGSFFVNTGNEPPLAFYTSYPADGAEVFSLTPLLEVSNSADVDDGPVTYTFQVYSDAALTDMVASSGSVPGTGTGTTSWVVDVPLEDNSTYYWKVIATDSEGAQTETEVALFHTNTQARPLQPPVISAPAVGAQVQGLEVDLVLNNTESTAVNYYFELDTADTFDSPSKQASGAIPEGSGLTTSWHVGGLEDNTQYYWRAKASDGITDSPWTQGVFFVSTANDAPPAPALKNP